jgi:hypothetical protein
VHQDGSLHSAGSNFIFRNNYAELCGEQGFDITTGTNVLLLNNISKNNSAGGVVVGHSADSVTIQNHTSLYEPTLPTSAAIKIGGDARNVKLIYSQIIGDGHHLLLIDGDNVEIYNNVFVWDGGGSLFDLSNEIENVIVKNNIFTTLQGSMSRVMRFLTPTRPPDHPTFEFDNNIYYTPDSVVTIYSSSTTTNYSLPNYQTTFGQDSNSFFAKPEFVDLAGSDFHLTSISPAIENGVDVNLNADFDNSFVPYNLFPDIGAFEYSDITLNAENSSFFNVLLYPNPINNLLFIQSEREIKNARIVNTHGQYIGMDVEIVNSSINTAFLKNGLYFLVLESEKEIFTTKFIVLH